MRFILLTFLMISSSACVENTKPDEQLLNEITGIWSASYDLEGFWLYGESLYRKNATSIHIGKICISNQCKITTVEEKFEIKNGVLTSTVVSSDDPDNPVGRVVSDRIKSIDNETLTFINAKGEAYERRRVLEPVYIKESE